MCVQVCRQLYMFRKKKTQLCLSGNKIHKRSINIGYKLKEIAPRHKKCKSFCTVAYAIILISCKILKLLMQVK